MMSQGGVSGSGFLGEPAFRGTVSARKESAFGCAFLTFLVIFIFGVFTSVPAAQPVCNPSMSIGDGWAGPCCGGAKVKVPINLHNCEPAEAFLVAAGFDSSALAIGDQSAITWGEVIDSDRDWLNIELGSDYFVLAGILGFGGQGGYEYTTIPVAETPEEDHLLAEVEFDLLDVPAGEYSVELDQSVTDPPQRNCYTVDGVPFTEEDGLQLVDGKVKVAPSCLDVDGSGSCDSSSDITYIFNTLREWEYVVPPAWREVFPDIPPDSLIEQAVGTCGAKYDVDESGDVSSSSDVTYLFNVLRDWEYVVPPAWREVFPDILPDEDITENVNALLPPVQCTEAKKSKGGVPQASSSPVLGQEDPARFWLVPVEKDRQVEFLFMLKCAYPVHLIEGKLDFESSAYELVGLEASARGQIDVVQVSDQPENGTFSFCLWNPGGEALSVSDASPVARLILRQKAGLFSGKKLGLKVSAIDMFLGPARVSVKTSAPGPVSFVRGDVNQDLKVNIADATRLIEYLFAGNGELPCLEAANINGDGSLDVSDPVSLLNYLFCGAKAPGEPYPECGVSQEELLFGCARSACNG